MAYYNLKTQKYFVHIAKNAGQSVARLLEQLPGDLAFMPMQIGHAKWNEAEDYLANLYPGVKFTGFAVFRNPYDRFVTAYDFGLFQTKLLIEGKHGKLAGSSLDHKKSWHTIGSSSPRDLLYAWGQYRKGLPSDIDFRAELPWMIPTLKSQCSYIGEDTAIIYLERNINKIRKMFSSMTEEEIPRFPKVNQGRLSYLKHMGLDQETKELIREIYAEDFERGNYTP